MHIISDILIVIMMVSLLQKLIYLKLLAEFKMHNLSTFFKLCSNVDMLTFFNGFVKSLVVFSFHGCLEFVFMLADEG